MDRDADPAIRQEQARAAARRRNDPLEAGLSHPIFDPIRPWLDRVGAAPSLEILNSFSEKQDLRTESGKPVRFVPPSGSDPYYEIQLFETGSVQTRLGSRHDLFNALAWLAFPKTKARINAMHARAIPREGGKRGRLRDMLTIFDEGGAVVVGSSETEQLVRSRRWKDLFLEHRRFRIVVVGHAVLEQALAPYPGITCKVVFADPARDLDSQCAEALSKAATPRDLPPLPVFGYPGWFPGNGSAEFYADARYFRGTPGSERARARCGAVKLPLGAGQAVAASQGAEESPGSTERDAG